jgi:TP901 family phage tail tape measure protein
MAEAATSTQKLKGATEDSAKAADTYLGKMVQSANKNREAWDTAGTTMLGFGAAAAGGLALAGKAAMDWESAWAGVTKTVDGTPEQMNELEGSLRNLAKTLPSTHEEIAAVAEAAGQLGVKREDVVGFTKTMVDLGETTNLTADEAATSIAQISNVMGTMERDGSKGVERFGATLVALGNAGASTEAEILEMAKRIAGAAKLVGASESDVLALSNAMASLGIEAQLGGGVISRVMQRMYGDVMEGGEGLENLAEVAGVSAKDFATAFETDPVRAVDMMIKGFGRIKDEGGNVIETMSELGIKGTEETGVILRLAGAGDILTDSLKLGDSAWKSNSALAAEAAKRYETTESKVKVAWNNIKDAAIDAGAVLLPIISGVAESVAGIAQAFGNLPDPVKGALTALGGVVGVAALGAGAFLTLTPKILDTVTAFNTLAPAGGKARGALGAAAGVAGKAAAAYAGLAAAASLAAAATEGNRRKTTIEDFSNALLGTAKNGEAAEKALDAAFSGVLKTDLISGGTTNVNSFADALDRVNHASVSDSIADFGNTLFGQNATSGINAAKDAIGNYDKALAAMASSGNFKDSAAGFKLAADKAKENGDSLEDLVELFPAYKDAILANKTANGETQVSQESLIEAMLNGGEAAEEAAEEIKRAGEASALSAEQTEEITKALEEVGIAADGTVTDLVKFTDALINAGLLQLSARDAARGFEEAIDAMAESLKENGATLDTNTDKGRANEAALDAIAGAGYRSAQAMAANGSSQEALAVNLDTTFNKLVEAARQFTNTDEEAQALARDIMKIPPGVDIKTWMADEAKRMAEATTGAINAIPKDVQVKITTTEHKIKILETQTRGVDDPSMAALDPGAHATGGRLPGYASGGQLPTSGPGTDRRDGFLGISSAGVPLARVDAGEWIIKRSSSDRYNRELAAINAGTFPKLPGYANGGREYSAQSFGHAPYRSDGSAARSGMHIDKVEINEQTDPRATFAEFARRTQSLNT